MAESGEVLEQLGVLPKDAGESELPLRELVVGHLDGVSASVKGGIAAVKWVC